MGLISLAAGSWWYEIWISLWLLICQGIYIFIGALYQVFEKVASVNLFSTEVFTQITSRMYIVMGIAMLFIFAYNLVLMIINPDQKKGSNNQMTKMVKDTIISLTLLVLLPLIFNWMYIFQSHILESNIIGQIILGDVGTTQGAEGGDYSKCASDDYECKCDFSQFDEIENYKGKVKILFGLISWDYNQDEKLASLERACKKYREDLTPSQRGAYSVAPTLLSAFYRPTNFNYNDCEEYLISGNSSLITNDEDKQICINFYYDVNYSKYTGNISAFSNDSYLKDIISDFDKDSMEFQWLMATVAGVLAVYMFFCYAMEIGVRVAKLGFLQLVSPIPVMMKIIPKKEEVFTTWSKQLIDTYLDVFIRLIIIYFCLFAVSLVPEVMSTLLDSTNSTSGGNFLVRALASVFVILGILKFAGQAPELFKQFFKGSGNFALKSPLKQIGENKLAMGGIGMAAGGIMNAYGNYHKATHDDKGNRDPNASRGKALASAAGGFFGGARRGAQHGAKAKDWDSFKHEMAMSKNETDLARQRRKDNKELPYKAAQVPLIGGALASGLDSLDKFRGFLQQDGSGKVALDATSDAKKYIEPALSQYTGRANVTAVDQERQEITNRIGAATEGQSVPIGGVDYTKGSGDVWSDPSGRTYNRAALDGLVDAFYKDRKRAAVADNMAKDSKTFFENMRGEMENMTTQLNKLGNDFSKSLMKKMGEELGKLTSNVPSGSADYTELKTLLDDIGVISATSSVSDLNTAMQKLETKFETTKDATIKREVGKVLYGMADTMKTEFTNEGNRLQNRAIQEKKSS